MSDDKKPITLYDKIMQGGIFGQIFQPRGSSCKYVVVGLCEGHSLNEVSLMTLKPKDFKKYSKKDSLLLFYSPLTQHDQDIWIGEAPRNQTQRAQESRLARACASIRANPVKDYSPFGVNPITRRECPRGCGQAGTSSFPIIV